ncbi:MAG: Chemotaxis response regulator protein-glutamate methylesterase [Gammaproteobacteria bacterium]|nr:Chemotaxis response regulator protein-glutamate methylesterase [Gammaproteobacteria bacterium]
MALDGIDGGGGCMSLSATTASPARVLAVDDEGFYLKLIEKYLAPAGFEVIVADSSGRAWELLEQQPQGAFDAVLLDRNMPGEDGIQFLGRIKSAPALRDVPVIIQTGLAEPRQVAEGIARGAYYYLAKPFASDVLRSIVSAAVRDYRNQSDLQARLSRQAHGNAMLQLAEFRCRTLEEVSTLAAHLALFFPDPQRVVTGISEFLLNAVEHGNLELSYADKSALLREGAWHAEIERRLSLPQFAGRQVRVILENRPDRVTLTVIDGGAGFDWQAYLDFNPARAFDLHGRGIAMSRLMCFDDVEYRGGGNEVLLTVMRQ